MCQFKALTKTVKCAQSSYNNFVATKKEKKKKHDNRNKQTERIHVLYIFGVFVFCLNPFTTHRHRGNSPHLNVI